MKIINDETLFSQLEELGVIDGEKLKNAQSQAKAQKKPLADVIYELDLLNDGQIGQIISDLYSLPFANLQTISISPEVRASLSEVFCRKQDIVAVKKDQDGLHLAVADPNNTQSIEFVAKKTGLPLRLYYTTKRSLERFWSDIEASSGSSFEKEVATLIEKASKNIEAETPVIALVDLILQHAQKNLTSDIHIEPQEKKTIVRFRIDSILHDICSLPASLHSQIVTRIKVLARLRVDEHTSAMDGKFQFKESGDKVDVRVSITPITFGEKIVLRLLSSSSRQFSLATMGLGEADLHKVESAYKKPFGMVLVTGPTGSGKTTTLYAVLKLLNNRQVNVMTIEDPVEYEIEGINQIQVNQATNLTFAEGLRSIVRQDPNVILVGEIRDEETAQIATNAAMTGHLVLSTMHTNDAATTIPRLFDMNIEPFIISSSINCIIAQRLVRQICHKCRASKEISRSAVASLGLAEPALELLFGNKDIIRTYSGKGCDLCHQSGYVGRLAIFEVMDLNDSIKTAIVERKTAGEINELAVKSGMTTLLHDGLSKVLSGITTVEEVIRVTRI